MNVTIVGESRLALEDLFPERLTRSSSTLTAIEAAGLTQRGRFRRSPILLTCVATSPMYGKCMRPTSTKICVDYPSMAGVILPAWSRLSATRGIFLCVVATVCAGTSASLAEADNTVDFNRDVRPILNEKCAFCHGGVKKSGGLSIVSRELLLARTESLGEPAVIPGRASESELIRRVVWRGPRQRTARGIRRSWPASSC